MLRNIKGNKRIATSKQRAAHKAITAEAPMDSPKVRTPDGRHLRYYSPVVDRIWQWAWDRYGTGYSWAIFVVSILWVLPIWLVSSMIITAYDHSDHYVEAAAVTVVAAPVLVYAIVLPVSSPSGSAVSFAYESG